MVRQTRNERLTISSLGGTVGISAPGVTDADVVPQQEDANGAGLVSQQEDANGAGLVSQQEDSAEVGLTSA